MQQDMDFTQGSIWGGWGRGSALSDEAVQQDMESTQGSICEGGWGPGQEPARCPASKQLISPLSHTDLDLVAVVAVDVVVDGALVHLGEREDRGGVCSPFIHFKAPLWKMHMDRMLFSQEGRG